MITRQQAIDSFTGPGQPYELVDAQVSGRALRVFRNAPSSLRELYASTASDLPFLRYQDEHWTFAEAWQAAARIGHVLVHDCGVVPGDRVAIAMRNYPEWILAFTAITSVGAVAVAMNGHWQSDEMAYALTNSGARVLFADQERLNRLPPEFDALQVLAVRPSLALAPDVRLLKDLTEALGPVAMPAVAIAQDDPATILYTSGSTGHPKGVVSSHRNILAALLSWDLDRAVGDAVAGMAPASPGDPLPAQAGTLLAVPLFHVTGLHASYLSSYRTQRRMVCMYRWDAQLAAALIQDQGLTSMVAPAAMSGDLVRVAQSQQYDLTTLLALGGGGAPRAPEQVGQIAASFPNALPATGWGMTETNAIGVGIGGQDYLDHPESSGRCSQVLQLKIIDESGQELPTGQRGELLVRGTSVFFGYWQQPEVSAKSFIGDWFRTGDVAYLDADGFLYIVDRIKDLIIRGGENIGCGMVEAALLQHPDVHEAAVYAVPDERLGEEVGATVYGSETLDVDALRAYLGEHLARFAVPRYILRADAPLHRTPSGKIFKREIRLAALAHLQSASPSSGLTGP
jgi:long-chain acyl-CoA synthetase